MEIFNERKEAKLELTKEQTLLVDELIELGLNRMGARSLVSHHSTRAIRKYINYAIERQPTNIGAYVYHCAKAGYAVPDNCTGAQEKPPQSSYKSEIPSDYYKSTRKEKSSLGASESVSRGGRDFVIQESAVHKIVNARAEEFRVARVARENSGLQPRLCDMTQADKLAKLAEITKLIGLSEDALSQFFGGKETEK